MLLLKIVVNKIYQHLNITTFFKEILSGSFSSVSINILVSSTFSVPITALILSKLYLAHNDQSLGIFPHVL